MKQFRRLIDGREEKSKKNSFAKSVAHMAGGAFFAQLIGILILPFLTRLYSPGDFGVLAIYAAATSIIISVAGLRFEIAIPLPKEDYEAVSLFILACSSCLLVSLIGAAVVFFAADQIVEVTKQPRIRALLWLFPVGIFIGGLYNALIYWGTREGLFNAIARTKIYQASTAAAMQLAIGLHNAAIIGLLGGYVVSIGAGGAGLLISAFKKIKEQLKNVSGKEIRSTFSKYQSFPKFSTIEALSNTAATQLPIIIIAAHLSSVEAGFLMLAIRCMQAPMSLIGNSISQVYLREAPEKKRLGLLSELTKNVIAGLFKTGVGVILCFGIVAEEFFRLVFGAEWAKAGEMVFWMLPWFVLQFVSSPISMVMHVAGRQRDMLVLTVLGFIMRTGAVFLAARYQDGLLFISYAVSGAFFYFICFWVFSNAAEISGRAMAQLVIKNSRILVLWIAFGFAIKHLLNKL